VKVWGLPGVPERPQHGIHEEPNEANSDYNGRSNTTQGLGAAQDAVRMKRVVSFYEKLPRGPAPQTQPKGLIGRYQAKYFGKNPSAARMSSPQSAYIEHQG
jgi:hypothetical protein